LLALALALNFAELAWRRLRQPALKRRPGHAEALPAAA
jgi:hypothetical protein